MTTIELFRQLSQSDQQFVLIYFVSGVLFMVFSYLIYYCSFIRIWIRIGSGTLMLSVGFLFLTTGGKMLQGTNYNLVFWTQSAVILCTVIALWVVVIFLRWNKEKQLEKEKK